MSQFQDTYRQEAGELLEQLEESLLELESDPGNLDIVNTIYRALHTIKGSGSMFGYDNIANFTHKVENLFDKMRQGTLQADQNLIDLTLEARDYIKLLLQETEGNGYVDNEKRLSLEEKLEKYESGGFEESEEFDKIEEPGESEEFEESIESDTASREFLPEDDLAQEAGADLSDEQLDQSVAGAEAGGEGESQGTLAENATPPAMGAAGQAQTAGPEAPASSQKSAAAGQTAASRKDNTQKLQLKSDEYVYQIRFQPKEEIFCRGTNPVLLLRELCDLGRCSVNAYTDQMPPLKEMDPERCYTSWDILLVADCDLNTVRDVFMFVEDACSLDIQVLQDASLEEELSEEQHDRIGEILVQRGDISREQLDQVLEGRKRLGELLVEKKIVPEDKIQSALEQQKTVRQNREEQNARERQSSIRIPSARLDKLVDLIGELVTSQAALSNFTEQYNINGLAPIAEGFERLITELREDTMSIRMVPIGTIFSRFRRLVRDLSHELGKSINLETLGAETELDKSIIENLGDPLIHLIRNSIDHGIESPERRRELGKPEQGTIELRAEHAGADVLVKVCDDGRGLDQETIRRKAVERGIISEEKSLSDQETFLLIFEPGFSTAEEVSDVSGRGVGMDVVKRAIDSMQGSIEIQSEADVGTTITLKLPLTLAIIDGMLIRIADDRYVMPVPSIEGVVEFGDTERAESHGRNMLKLRGEFVPLVGLRRLFSIEEDRPKIEQVVLVALEGKQVGFVVDEIIGKHQTVIKSLGRLYKKISGFSGATILGDGRIALILDMLHLYREAESEEDERLEDKKGQSGLGSSPESPESQESVERIESAERTETGTGSNEKMAGKAGKNS